MNIEGALIREIVVEPILASDFEETVIHALLHAIEYKVNVTVLFQGKDYHIMPREIFKRIFDQQREEGDSR